MYVRRKVFSVLVDETGEERLYSVNETLLEGFEYEEREFAEKEEEPKKGGEGCSYYEEGSVDFTTLYRSG